VHRSSLIVRQAELEERVERSDTRVKELEAEATKCVLLFAPLCSFSLDGLASLLFHRCDGRIRGLSDLNKSANERITEWQKEKEAERKEHEEKVARLELRVEGLVTVRSSVQLCSSSSIGS
jgi:hypothetical protein